jgi:hypothetical protein
VPPFPVAETEPVLCPKQLILVEDNILAVKVIGAETTLGNTDVHPFAELTVTVYVPAAKLFKS